MVLFLGVCQLFLGICYLTEERGGIESQNHIRGRKEVKSGCGCGDVIMGGARGLEGGGSWRSVFSRTDFRYIGLKVIGFQGYWFEFQALRIETC